MDKPIFFTGVGSRETPPAVLANMRSLGRDFAKHGWILRSGAADGADQAFEEGALSVHCTFHDCHLYGVCYADAHGQPARCDSGRTEIYLPWPKFNGHKSSLHLVHGDSHGKAAEIAASCHPRWTYLKQPVRNLHMRNVYQVLGKDLNTPSTLLVCWTPDGCESKAERTEFTGGTGTAIEVAWNYKVPIFNLQRPGRLALLQDLLAIV
jgi:hypothetical protein